MTDGPMGRSPPENASNEGVPAVRELSLYLRMSGRTLYR